MADLYEVQSFRKGYVRAGPHLLWSAKARVGFGIRKMRRVLTCAALSGLLVACGEAGSTSDGSGTAISQVASGGPTPVARPMSLDGEPIYTRTLRLTNEQWAQTVKDVFALKALPDAYQAFERAVAGTTDFSNNEHVLSVSGAQSESYQRAAEQIAQTVTSSPQSLAAVYAGTDASGFVRKLGRRLFRRPLTTQEEQSYLSLFNRGATLSGTGTAFAKGAGLVIRGLLQSPYFLYRTELGATGAPLSAYEVAAKLSFWLLGTTPSEALLDAAAAGSLDSAQGAAQMATQLLEQPAAAAAMQQFHRELAHFDLYSTISKIGVADYAKEMNLEFERSSYLFFDRIFTKNLGLREILTSTVGYVGPKMAKVYGVSAPASGLEERELGAGRAGYFTQLPFLALYGFNEQPDPIHRGVILNLEFLCADPGKPAANLPPIPALKPGQTNREMITTLTSGCGGTCHNSYINPIGFAFEGFDGMGRARTTDNGRPVDTKSAYPFAEGYKEFDGAAALMKLMAESKQAHACYAKKIASYALQRDIVRSDQALLDSLTNVSMAGGSLKKVMLELVKAPAFRTRLGATP